MYEYYCSSSQRNQLVEVAADSARFYDLISLFICIHRLPNPDLMGVQEFIVIVVLVVAVIYLVLRFTKKKTGCGDDCNCH